MSWNKLIRVAVSLQTSDGYGLSDQTYKPIPKLMNVPATIPFCCQVSLTAKEFLHSQHLRL